MTDTTNDDRHTTTDALTLPLRPGCRRAQGAAIQAKVTDKLDELLDLAEHDAVRRSVAAAPEGGCTERTWCNSGPSEEHLSYHSGGELDLAGATRPDDAPTTGRWCWLEEDRGLGTPRVSIEGVLSEPDGSLSAAFCSTFDVVAAWDLLSATVTPEAHAALLELVTKAMAES